MLKKRQSTSIIDPFGGSKRQILPALNTVTASPFLEALYNFFKRLPIGRILKSTSKFFLRALPSIFLLFSTEIYAMSIFDTGKVCTFSGISGVILKGGKPVADATVTRTTSYQKKKIDQTKTDKEGYFELPALFERSAMSLLPQEFVVGQLLVVTVDGTDHVIWDGVKRKKEENSEARGKPLVITCDIEDETRVVEVNGQPFVTKCRWDVVPDKVNKGF